MLIRKSLQSLMLTMLLVCFASVAVAEGREFPAQAKRGKLSITALADLVIDGKLRSTTPATRIYSEDGMTITSSALDAVNAPVNYTENEIGEIEKIWLLTALEARQPMPKNN
jgi:hypothetical protein